MNENEIKEENKSVRLIEKKQNVKINMLNECK
jgi:hypothetical protein